MITESSNADYIKMLSDILTKGTVVADGVSVKCDKEINVKVSLIDGGCKVEFLPPEPIFTITKIISISDSVDYIKLMNTGKVLVKIRGWMWEIPLDF